MAAYLLVTVAIGLYVNRFISGMSDYVVAGRSLKSSIGIATMVGSELGLVTVMYMSQKGLTGGFAAFHIGLVGGLSTLLVGLTGFIVVPLRERGVMTIPEFYGQRFGRSVRIVGAVLLALSGILNMGMFLKAGALFVTALTGLSDPMAVNYVMTGLLVIVLIYTVLGGMVSVVITDYMQFVLLSFGMLLTCVLALNSLGWQTLVDTVTTVHGSAGLNPLDDANGFGVPYIVWMIYTAGFCSCAVWQTAVMRACAADSVATVKRLYIFSSIGFLIRFILPQFLGICALAWFFNNDALRPELFAANGQLIENADLQLQATPAFLGQLLPVGLVGLIGATMLAAFMSTHDSYLLCWASVIAHDIVAPIAGPKFTDKNSLLVARIMIVLIGVFLLVWGLWYPLGQNLWDYMAVTGAIYFTGAFAVLVGGLYWKRASSAGALCALLCGLLALGGLEPVKAVLPASLHFSSEIVGLGTATLALVSMVVVSILVPDRADESQVVESNQ